MTVYRNNTMHGVESLWGTSNWTTPPVNRDVVRPSALGRHHRGTLHPTALCCLSAELPAVCEHCARAGHQDPGNQRWKV